ncbi:MAG: glycine cleavage system aminomethyltransferase GcvT [Candidatus Omnitrophica bacterium]|nr:glycine cleavage system aminomethyltransferase GcvT [Candidatus Omnitrophota bacterium]
MEDTLLRQTPLFKLHKALGARLAPFGGWLMPIQYKGILTEHQHTRSSASLFDICHMGEFMIYGDVVKSGIENIITFSLSGMEIGKCHYGFMLNKDGGIIDDLVIYKLAEEKYMIVVNAATKNKDFAHLKENLSTDAKLEDISEDTAKLDLQGPLSRDILVKLVSERVLDLGYYSFGHFAAFGEDNIISRTGYTGELGYELYVKTSMAESLWNMLLADERIEPAGLGARDTLRLEMGYPLYGQDIDDKTTPLEAGLEHFVDFNKEFIGKDALIKQKKEGLSKKLASFKTDSRRSPRHNDKIFAEGKEVGIVTSGSFSPSLGMGIGIGYVENGYDWLGAKITIKSEKSELEAKIIDKPFYKEGTARK